MSHVDRFGGRHPLCHCPERYDESTGFTMIAHEPDCRGVYVIDADEMRELVEDLKRRHGVAS